MKHIDFTKTGGFPLTQDVLDMLQANACNALVALAQAGGGGSTGPYAVSGCQVTVSGTAYTVAPGYIFYNGELFFCAGATINTAAAIGGNVPGFAIVETDTPLTYNDGSINATAITNRVLNYQFISNTTTAAQFPLYSLQLWNRAAAATSGSAASTGGTSGTYYYRKNWLANTLQLYGTVTISNAQSLPASVAGTGPVYYQVGQMPAGCIPNAAAPIAGYVRYHTNLIKDDQGVDYIKQLNGEVDTTGSLSFGLIKPASGITTYSFYFNTIIPLD